jgi:hypothetical protein
VVTRASALAVVARLGLGGPLAGLLGLAAAAPGCKPNLDQTISIVGEPIVLSVRSDPAEVAPTKAVRLTALYVDRNGPLAQAPIDWAFCTARNPLANLGAVNPDCLKASGPQLVSIGVGVQASGAVPDIACRQFGPDVPEPVPGEPQGRPVDPDPTGGYYQPARLLIPGDAGASVGISETRLACGPGLASGNAGVEYTKRYHANTNPTVASLAVLEGGSPGPAWVTADSGGTNAVQVGAHVSLRVGWAPCPEKDVCGDGFCGPDESAMGCPADCTTPAGCTGAERYAGFDVPSQSVVDRREAMAIAWFATGGSFDSDRTGRETADLTPSSDNAWTAPTQPGPVHLWVVLGDDRGGAGWAEYLIEVK